MIHDCYSVFFSFRENLGDQPERNHCCLWYNLKRRLVFGLAASAVKVWLVSSLFWQMHAVTIPSKQRKSFIHWQPKLFKMFCWVLGHLWKVWGITCFEDR